MSAINQMLRDLDARNAPQTSPALVLEAAGDRHSGKRGWVTIPLVLLGLGIVIAGGFFAMRDRAGQREVVGSIPHAAPVAALTPKAPVAVVPVQPIKLAAPAPAVEASVLAPSAAVVTSNLAPPPVMPKLANALKPPALILPKASETVASSTSEVIKHNVELSPSAAAQQLLDEANALRREGKPDAARRKYRDALERNSGLSSARIQLAETMNEQGETEAALAVLKAAYNQQPDPDLAVASGRMLASRGQRAEALIWFARGGAVLRPADHALSAALLAQDQRYDEAIRAYQTALSADPHKGGWLLGLGLALEATGRREEAQTAYQQALAWGEFKPEVVKFLNERLVK
ncbi:MAG: tetratricopeptide repeat protein [Thiobacillaceae bacterium]